MTGTAGKEGEQAGVMTKCYLFVLRMSYSGKAAQGVGDHKAGPRTSGFDGLELVMSEV